MLRTTLLATALLFAGAANAGVSSGTLDSGTAKTNGGVFTIVAPFAQVGNNRQQDNNVYAWNEVQNFTLLADLAIDLGGTSIAAGTAIASHGVVFDPASNRSAKGTITFDRDILGVITGRTTLKASDFLNGGVTAFDDVSARGLEASDFNKTSFSGNVLSYDWTASSPGDNIRVITSAVPEPGTWALLIAGFGLVGFAARRRQTAAAAVA